MPLRPAESGRPHRRTGVAPVSISAGSGHRMVCWLAPSHCRSSGRFFKFETGAPPVLRHGSGLSLPCCRIGRPAYVLRNGWQLSYAHCYPPSLPAWFQGGNGGQALNRTLGGRPIAGRNKPRCKETASGSDPVNKGQTGWVDAFPKPSMPIIKTGMSMSATPRFSKSQMNCSKYETPVDIWSAKRFTGTTSIPASICYSFLKIVILAQTL